MEGSFQTKRTPFDLAALLHPSKVFPHPMDVVRDADVTTAEKRSVLASWASDGARSSRTRGCGLPQQAASSAMTTSLTPCSHWTTPDLRKP
jgi:hypothetical protein